jgi:hypothetical protein
MATAIQEQVQVQEQIQEQTVQAIAIEKLAFRPLPPADMLKDVAAYVRYALTTKRFKGAAAELEVLAQQLSAAVVLPSEPSEYDEGDYAEAEWDNLSPEQRQVWLQSTDLWQHFDTSRWVNLYWEQLAPYVRGKLARTNDRDQKSTKETSTFSFGANTGIDHGTSADTAIKGNSWAGARSHVGKSTRRAKELINPVGRRSSARNKSASAARCMSNLNQGAK